MSKNAKDFIEKLLTKDPKKRLGTKGDLKSVLAQPWFFDINHKELMAKKIKPDFVPEVKEKDGQVDYFDQKFV